MRTRLLLLLTLLGSVLIYAGFYFTHPAQAPLAAPASAAPAAKPRPPRVDFGAARSADDVARALEDAYRLDADRRLVAAVAQVRELSGGRSDAARAVWQEGRWQVLCGPDDAGTLPESPSFLEGLQLCESVARKELAARPLAEGAADGRAALALADFSPEAAIAFLEPVLASAGPSRALLAQSLAAAVQLSLGAAADKSGFADDLASRTLALLALARVADGAPHEREACLLAWTMGYRADARTLAAGLPPDDPVRRLAMREDGPLLARADASGAPSETRLLALFALARAGRADEWSKRANTWFRVGSAHAAPVLGSALLFARFDMQRDLPEALCAEALRGLAVTEPSARAGAFEVGRFELAMREHEAHHATGPTRGLVVAARRALFYSGVVQATDFAANTYSDETATREVADAAGAASRGRAGAIARWQAHLAEAKTGVVPRAALQADLDSLELAPEMAYHAFAAISDGAIAGLPETRDAVHALARQLDSRPASEVILAWEVQGWLLWPERAERLLASAVAHAGDDDPRVSAFLRLMRRDFAGLDALLAREDLGTRDALWMLMSWLQSDSTAADRLEPRFAALAAKAPGDWPVAEALADLREARGRFVTAEAPVRVWLSRERPNADALDRTAALTTLARLRRKQGDVEGALLVIRDLDEGYQYGAMAEKARLLALDRRAGAALEIARKARERYPDSEDARGLAAEILWRSGDDAAAAKAVAEFDPDGDAWREGFVGPFLNVFHGRPEAAKAALAAMKGVVPGLALRGWALGGAAAASDPALAIELMRQAPASGGIERSMQLAQVFALRSGLGGEAAALAWLDTLRLAPALAEVLVMDLAARGELRAAWRCAHRGRAALDDFGWLTLASAWRLAGSPAGAERDTLLAVAREPGDSYYRGILRYLLGESDEATVLALATDNHTRAEVWYYCATLARSGQRWRDAARWYQLVLETGSTRDGEWIWAQHTLNRWAGCWCVPERLPAPVTGGPRRPAAAIVS